ncbi:phytoene dehydrogenase-related protein [Skeletonema marinoi]|uniref:Amine oxidase n=1 Tax=Skeletonema marinoi TaxID=267567 RepID=A0AAD9DK72_9STRA|nr:phytoene dehydrogenase-related protein [Skeletonema marinoi]
MKIIALLPIAALTSSTIVDAFSLRPISTKRAHHVGVFATAEGSNIKEEDWDVVVIGAGIGGLSAAALSARYGLKTICVEAHDVAGGVAHSFERKAPASIKSDKPFVFDSGPSLLSGMSQKGTNPLRQVLDAVGTANDIDWITYDGWMVYDTAYPAEDEKATFRLTTGNDGAWEKAIEKKAGIPAREAFTKFRNEMMAPNGLSESSALIPPLALRSDLRAVFTMAQYLLKFLGIGLKGQLLTGPFTKSMDLYGLTDKFNRQWFDYLAFALSGLDAAHTQAAPVSYTMIDLHKDGAVLDYPKGGMDSLIQALVRGLEMSRPGVGSGELRLKSRVEKFNLEEENNKAVCKGVTLEDGTVVNARRGVICNAPLWNMARLLEDSVVNGGEESEIAAAVRKVRTQANEMEMTGSFMHIHLGIPAAGLPDDLDCHHSVLNLEDDVTAEQNLVIVSIPTIFDPNLAPDGFHVIHAYTAASENFQDWENKLDGGVDNGKTEEKDYQRTKTYKDLKEEKTEALWLALERIIPDIRERAKQQGSIVEVGTPLTHRRYNRRFRGTYGPAPPEGKDVWELPSAKTPIEGLLACGDTCFPGIGLPGVAASGTIAANTLVDSSVQLNLMDEMKKSGALQ